MNRASEVTPRLLHFMDYCEFRCHLITLYCNLAICHSVVDPHSSLWICPLLTTGGLAKVTR